MKYGLPKTEGTIGAKRLMSLRHESDPVRLLFQDSAGPRGLARASSASALRVRRSKLSESVILADRRKPISNFVAGPPIINVAGTTCERTSGGFRISCCTTRTLSQVEQVLQCYFGHRDRDYSPAIWNLPRNQVLPPSSLQCSAKAPENSW